MNSYPVNYRITFFIKDGNFNIERHLSEVAKLLSEKFQCKLISNEYIPVFVPNGIIRQMVATFASQDQGIMVKIQDVRVDINLQKTAEKELTPLQNAMEKLMQVYFALFENRVDLSIARVACCTTYLFDGDEGELNMCYHKVVNDFEKDSPVEWEVRRISRLPEDKNYPARITNNIFIKRLFVRGRFEEQGQNRILSEIDLNSFPEDVVWDNAMILHFLVEIPKKEEITYQAIKNKLLKQNGFQ